MKKFDALAQAKLGFYVYALFDPEHPTVPFYIGKGQGDRVFDHATAFKMCWRKY
jgi:hypothetical protein